MNKNYPFNIWRSLVVSLVILISTFSPALVSARSVVTEWYVKDLQTEIVVNKDSSLDITEDIVADCGNLSDKHGIFRILPTFYQMTTEQKVNIPVTLTSITDFAGKNYNYQETLNTYNKTVTWKIGEANKTVKGVNNYRIKYKVENTIRFGNTNFDEFYWNLNGAFWDMEIDHFKAKVIFPEEVKKDQAEIFNYLGSMGEKGDGSEIKYEWLDEHTLTYELNRTLQKQEGITTSVTFPKGIITQPEAGKYEKYNEPVDGPYDSTGAVIGAGLVLGWVLILLFIPILTLLLCLYYWNKYGRDRSMNKPIIAEYGPPENMSPILFSALWGNGEINNQAVAAGVISMAVKGVVKIEEIKSTGWFGTTDYTITLQNNNEDKLDKYEKLLLEKLKPYATDNVIKMNDLSNKFYRDFGAIKESAKQGLKNLGVFESDGDRIKGKMMTAGLIVMVIGFFTMFVGLGLSFIISAIILMIFAVYMPKKSVYGDELYWKAKGFELFMNTAEKYRQQFNEKENIFEKFLPYAIVLGITKKWAEKMKIIYGEKYFDTYHPTWLSGASLASMNFDSFSSTIDSMSSNMSTTMSSSPSSSGSGGGGFSGGGGGGGGGGGW